MKISELVKATHTPATTIRFYVREGVLREPVLKGKTVAYYSPLHVEQLEYIKELKKDNYALKEIKRLVAEKYSGMTDDHADTRFYTGKREEIIQASVNLYLKKGYHGTTITDIVNNAGIGRGTFYIYFENKEELFFECADKFFSDLDSHFNILKDESNILYRLKRRGYEFLLSFPTLINMLNIIRGASVSDSAIFRDKLDKMLEQLISPIVEDVETGMKSGEIRKTDSTFLGHVLMGIVEYVSYYSYELENELDESLLNDLFHKGWDKIYNGARNQK